MRQLYDCVESSESSQVAYPIRPIRSINDFDIVRDKVCLKSCLGLSYMYQLTSHNNAFNALKSDN